MRSNTSSFAALILRTLIAGSALPVIAMASPALAAEPPQADQAEAPSSTAATTSDDGDILVTATRREESSRNVPISVTAISGEKLDVLNSSGLDIRFLSSRVPSLQIESSFGRTFPRFYIRGLGNTDFDINAAQPVSVVYDDVALENPLLKSFPVFDLQNVQVLRGPQGTLFGRNTPAGVVKIDSVKPSDTYSGYASASWATYNTINAEAAAGGPLGGGFAFRASALLQYRDNWVTNSAPTFAANRELEGYTDYAGRLQIGYSGGDFNALLNVHGRNLIGTPRVFRAGLFRQGSNQFSAGFNPNTVSLDGYTSQSLSQYGVNLHLDYHLDAIGTFYSVTSYEEASVESTGDIDGGSNYTFPALGLNNALFPSNTGGSSFPREFSQELRFASDEFGRFRAQGGLYYFYQSLKFNEFSYRFPATLSRARDLEAAIAHDNVNENYGVFASLEYRPTDALTLRAGGRYSRDRRNDLVSGFSPFLFGVVLPIRTRTSDGEFTWDVNATYAASKEISFYGRVATGYQGPAIQDRVTFGSSPTAARKQTTLSAEGGIKGALLDRSLRFALSGYWFETKDLQITAVGGAVNSARLLNAAKAVGYGVEGEVEARPFPNFTLTASGSYNFTEIRDPNVRVGVCGSLCTVVDPVTAGLATINGNPLPQAPKFVGNLTARYAIPVGSTDEIYLYTDWAYRSSINYFLYDALEFRGRPLLEGGLKLGYKAGDKVDFGIFARNITNQIRSISAIDFNNLTGMINEPRIIGGQVRITM